MNDPHTAHGSALLSLTSTDESGGRLVRSWTVCDCTLDGLAAGLGPVQQQSYTSEEEAKILARAVTALGGIHILTEGEEPSA